MKRLLRMIARWFRLTKPTASLSPVAERVVAGAVAVLHALGAGMPEIIYENALAHELRKAGLSVTQQKSVAVFYDGVVVGDYAVDLVVENTILVELETAGRPPWQTAARRQYLCATGFTQCVLLDFGKSDLAVRTVLIPT